jgi:hypothetical protein
MDAGPEQPKKKRKIDLKERLSTVRAAGTMAGVAAKPEAAAAAFPPAPRGSVPPPRVMSSDGIAPPPAIAALMGVGTAEEPEAPRQTAAQQTIKVEMGDEVLAERRKLRKRSILYAAIAGVVALIAGFAVGGVKERGDQSRIAIAGANDLAKQIEESNKVMLDLSDAVRAGVDELKNEKFPTALAEQLKGINVPFSAATLNGKQVSGLTGSALQGLLSYSRGIENLNKTKDKLRNLLGVAQKPVEEYNAEKKAPVFKFAVVFAPQNAGMVAELAPLKKPFKVGEKWPEAFQVVRLVNDKATDVDAVRWLKGDLTGNKPVAIPIEPKTVAGFTGQKIILDLRGALAETAALVEGNQSPIPSEQTDGLLKEGQRIAEELKKIARAK